MLFYSSLMKNTFVKIWYLSAIEIIDTQVAERGRQYHSQPTLTKKKEPSTERKRRQKQN